MRGKFTFYLHFLSSLSIFQQTATIDPITSIGSITMIKEATAMTVRQNLGELLNGIQYGHDQIVITKGGTPVAAMVDVVLFDKIRLMKKEFNRLSDEIAATCQGVDANVVQQEINAAINQARKR